MIKQVHKYVVTSSALLLMMISGVPCSAQKTASVLNVRGNILYIGIDNYLTAIVEGVDCDSLILTTDNGEIKGNGCGWSIRVTGQGRSDIQVSYTDKGDTINAGVTKFRVQPLPPPNIAVANRYKPDSLTISQILDAPYISACLLNFDFDLRYNVNSFNTIILRNDSCIFSEKNTGCKLSENLTTFLSQCRTSDRLIICSAEVYGIRGKEKVAPVEYILKQ